MAVAAAATSVRVKSMRAGFKHFAICLPFGHGFAPAGASASGFDELMVPGGGDRLGNLKNETRTASGRRDFWRGALLGPAFTGISRP
jgi:hypothetical protein